MLRARGDRTWFAGPAAVEEGGQLPRREEPPTPPPKEEPRRGGRGKEEPCQGGEPCGEGRRSPARGRSPAEEGRRKEEPRGVGRSPAGLRQSVCSVQVHRPPRSHRLRAHPQPLGSRGRWLCGPPRLPLRARPSHSRPRGSTLLPERSVLTAKGRNKGQDKPDDCVLSSFLIRNGKRRAAGSQ